MKKVTPKILQGFMELLPREQIMFNQMKTTIAETYESFGFLPMDTPVIESADVLLAKAGGETEKQIYRFEKGANDLCLRFDLTVPFSRFVAQHHNNLSFPFRRYQIGKVYRGERPQKGRFREFYQCDIDIVGAGELGLVYDAEILAVLVQTLKNLQIPDFVVNVSSRKILSGLMASLGLSEKSQDVLRIIDKFSKIGQGGVSELLEKELGLNKAQIQAILKLISFEGNSSAVLEFLKSLGIENAEFMQGVRELEEMTKNLAFFGVSEENFVINLSIARGLDYYTGMVYETFLKGRENLGSIASGGRYENLAGNYTEKSFPGVGVCIGLTRLFDVLLQENLLPSLSESVAEAIIVPMGESEKPYAIKIANILRGQGIKCEVYLEDGKFKNKMQYASKSQIQYAVILGEDECKNNVVALKNLKTFEQTTCTIEQAVQKIKSGK